MSCAAAKYYKTSFLLGDEWSNHAAYKYRTNINTLCNNRNNALPPIMSAASVLAVRGHEKDDLIPFGFILYSAGQEYRSPSDINTTTKRQIY